MPYHPYQTGNHYDYTFNMFNPTYQPRIEHFNSGNNKSKEWEQCGGEDWTGSEDCQSGCDCVTKNSWYSMCQPKEEGCVCNTPTSSEPSGEGYTILDILPRSETGENLWTQIFPAFKEGGTCNPQHKNLPRDDPDRTACGVFDEGDLSGLDNFLDAALQYPNFCSGPDLTKNKRELAAFFANMYQETGCGTPASYQRNCQISEVGENGRDANSIGGYFGRGPLQLTMDANYALASRGIENNKWDWNLSCKDVGEEAFAPPPQGVGANICGKNRKKVYSDPIISWSTGIWYWVNRPMSEQATWGYRVFGAKSCHQIMQSDDCSTNCFAGTIQVINGALECSGEQNINKTNSRIDFYIHIGKILQVPEIVDNEKGVRDCLQQTCKNKQLQTPPCSEEGGGGGDDGVGGGGGNRCGTTWDDANTRTPIIKCTLEDCPGELKCYAGPF